jgi:hypothetical protein
MFKGRKVYLLYFEVVILFLAFLIFDGRGINRFVMGHDGGGGNMGKGFYGGRGGSMVGINSEGVVNLRLYGLI